MDLNNPDPVAGSNEIVDFRWRQYLDGPPARHMVALREFLTVASAEPRLRALYPFTSLIDLGFKRTRADTHDQALAWVRPFGEGRFLIAGADRRQLYSPGPTRRTVWGGEPVPGARGPADARESVALVLAALDQAG